MTLPEPESLELQPENIPLDIVYEDDDLLVVNKPKGMVVHPAPGHSTGTLVHALLYHCGDRLSSINGVIRPGIVHRIDRFTSGLLMVDEKRHGASVSLSTDRSPFLTHGSTRQLPWDAFGNRKARSMRRSADIRLTAKKCALQRRIPNQQSHTIP